MLKNIDRRPASLLELFRRAKLAEQALRGEPVATSREHRADREREGEGEIVSRRDERGTPYPGDFPNDLAGYYRGCF
jgi:hypothetical protein